MNALEGKVPANVKIYHYGVPGRKHYDLTNPVILNRPVLSLDPFAMAQARIYGASAHPTAGIHI